MSAPYCLDAFVRQQLLRGSCRPDGLHLQGAWYRPAAIFPQVVPCQTLLPACLRRPVCIHLAATPKAESGGSGTAAATERTDTVRRIRLASSWQGVAGAVLESGASCAEVAFALYRVGCLSCLMSAQQRAGDQPCCLAAVCSPFSDTACLVFGVLMRRCACLRRYARTKAHFSGSHTELPPLAPCHTLRPGSLVTFAAQRWRHRAWWAAWGAWRWRSCRT